MAPVATVKFAKGAFAMRRLFIALPVFITSLAVINPASAERDLRHFGALGLGLGIPDDAAFRENYRQGFSGSLGYGTRLGRSGRFFAYGFLAYNRFRAKEHVRIGDDYFINFGRERALVRRRPGAGEFRVRRLGPGRLLG